MKQSRFDKTTFKLLDDFDKAARDWGWTQDQGTGKAVDNSEAEYTRAKEALIRRINQLHRIRRQK